MKNTKKQEGITLIALVVTIIVLLILAGVAIVMLTGDNGILTKTTDAKTANEQAIDYENVRLAAQAAYSKGYPVNGKVDKTILVSELQTSGIISGDDQLTEKEKNGVKTYSVTKDGKIYTISENGSVTKANLKQWTLTTDIGDTGLSVGDLITSKKKITEQFYVIGFSGENDSTVKLLAKYNLKSDGSEQDTGALNTCVFSSTNYWSSYTGSYPLNLNDYEIPSTATSIITTAAEYGESLDVETGRLMTVEEVEDLGGSRSNGSVADCPEFINTRNFWLGSAYRRGLRVVRAWYIRR